MSSPIQVKQELAVPDDILSNVPTDDESETEDICIDNLQLLDPKVASQSKFPVGCKVWYNARKSKSSKKLRAKSGCVVGVYFDFQSMRHVYRVKSSADCQHTLYEDRLVYGMNCPVKVTNPYTKEAEDGVIVLPQLDAENDGKQQISYAVQFVEGRHVSVEFLVAAERVVYREVKDNELVFINDGIEGETESNVAQEGDAEMKKRKVDGNLKEKEKAATASKNEGKSVGSKGVAVNVGEAGQSLAQIVSKKPETADKQLLLLHHSSKCHSSSDCEIAPYCAEMQKLWKHMARCMDNDCRFPRCFWSRKILSHYRRCTLPRCPTCGPVRAETERRETKKRRTR